MFDATAESFHHLLSALLPVACQVNHGLRVERGDPFSELPRRLFGIAVEMDVSDSGPCGVRTVWRLHPSTDAKHGVPGFLQPRRQVTADMSSATDDYDTHQYSSHEAERLHIAAAKSHTDVLLTCLLSSSYTFEQIMQYILHITHISIEGFPDEPVCRAAR
jgi:hypothetical protein